jgi:hypothetical protein
MLTTTAYLKTTLPHYTATPTHMAQVLNSLSTMSPMTLQRKHTTTLPQPPSAQSPPMLPTTWHHFLHNLLMTSRTRIQMTFGVTDGGLHFPPDVPIFILLVVDRCLKLSNGCGKHQCKNDTKFFSGCYLRIGWAQETFLGAEIKSYRHMSVFSAICMLRKHWSIFFYIAILREAARHL